MREENRRKKKKEEEKQKIYISKENLKRYERQMIIVDRIWIVLFRFFLHIIILFLIPSILLILLDMMMIEGTLNFLKSSYCAHALELSRE